MEEVRRIYAELEKESLIPTSSNLTKPDIVVVMSESLFDPLLLNGVQWKKDPLAFTRTLAPEGQLTRAMVPTFGGKTANSEFEFLTGNSMKFLNMDLVPYNGLLTHEQESLARTLAGVGYNTIAIHPGLRHAWNRDTVYKNLGFHTFISGPDFDNSPKFGNHVADEAILEKLEKTLLSEEPTFHFIVTLQNHMPYDNPFDLSNPLFETSGLSREELPVLNHYSRLLEATDRFHQKLFNLLSQRKRPTVLIIFGDHLPPFLDNFGIYYPRMIGSTEPADWSVEEKLKMYSTPLIEWSNFPLEKESEPLQVVFLGVRLLRKLGLPLTPYQSLVAKISDRLRVINPILKLPDSDEIRKLVGHYHILQHHAMTVPLNSPHQVVKNISNITVSDQSLSETSEMNQ